MVVVAVRELINYLINYKQGLLIIIITVIVNWYKKDKVL